MRGLEQEERINMYRDKVPVDYRLAANVMHEAKMRFAKALSEELNPGERTYARAIIDPFAASSMGARVPSLNPVDSYTYTQNSNFTLSTTGYNAAGKALIFFNPTAVATGPVAVLQDPEGIL